MTIIPLIALVILIITGFISGKIFLKTLGYIGITLIIGLLWTWIYCNGKHWGCSLMSGLFFVAVMFLEIFIGFVAAIIGGNEAKIPPKKQKNMIYSSPTPLNTTLPTEKSTSFIQNNGREITCSSPGITHVANVIIKTYKKKTFDPGELNKDILHEIILKFNQKISEQDHEELASIFEGDETIEGFLENGGKIILK